MSELSEFMERGQSMKFSKWGMSQTDSTLLTAEISSDGYLRVHFGKDGVPAGKIQFMPELLRALADWVASKIDSEGVGPVKGDE